MIQYRIYRLVLFLSFGMILILSGCKKITNSDPFNQQAYFEERYQTSVSDAITADSSEICDTLWAINSSNTKLEWKTINNEQYVLVGNFNRHPESYSDTSLVNSWGVIWVFLPEQMKSRMLSSTFPDHDTLLRLRQLLGLPPSNTNTYVVELWVKPQDLYRPAGDPEIGDHTANAYLPENADPNYIPWFNQNIYDSYFSNWTHYPWTRLGYSYDWGNPASEVGLSEFCIKKNSMVYVKKLNLVSDYLKN